jgi:hypothetical protein
MAPLPSADLEDAIISKLRGWKESRIWVFDKVPERPVPLRSLMV